jgi:DNA (cytosine-5)-methyltransferase 1
MEQLKIISCFSGIGGLEGSNAPIAVCEIDPDAQKVLRARFPEAALHPDIEKMKPPSADFVLGGWPCQDISIAGEQKGLVGERSRLFYDLLRIGKQSNSHTIVAENVPNLLKLRRGKEFYEVLEEFSAHGYQFVSWRTLNARQFGLPQERRRVFIVASKFREVAQSLHREIERAPRAYLSRAETAFGFYWTAGIQGLSYHRGICPTIKVGSSLDIASPPAVHFDGIVRKLMPSECLRLQGFTSEAFGEVSNSAIYRMAGNAVALPVGRFVVDGASMVLNPSPLSTQAGFFGSSGVPTGGWSAEGHWESGEVTAVHRPRQTEMAANLSDFLEDDFAGYELSARAASGLIMRMDSSGKRWPVGLREALTARLVPHS